jgi:hypothetical protein
MGEFLVFLPYDFGSIRYCGARIRHTVLPAWFHLAGFPEVFLQSGALAFLTHYWVNHPEKKWLSCLKFIASMTVVNTLLAWIILPVLALSGRAPSDDVTYFLRCSRMAPLLLSGLAAALYAGGWLLFLSKIDGLRKEFLLFGETDPGVLTAGARTTFAVMAGVSILCLLLTLGANRVAAKNPLGRLSPPQDFQQIAQLDLSSRSYSEETLAQFSFDQATWVGVFIAVRDIDTTYFDLSVIGPDGASSVILHGEGYRSDQDGGLWEQNLPPGAYRLVLNSAKSPGSASVYLNY